MNWRRISSWAILLASCMISGLWLGDHAWERIILPFHNPLGAVGLLTLQKFNPVNNQVRYLVFVSMPSVLLLTALGALRLARRDSWLWTEAAPQVAQAALPAQRAPWEERAARWALFASWGMLVAFALVGVAQFLELDLAQKMDLFHEGESLSPAMTYVKTGRLWTGSYFAHGVGYDPLGTYWMWRWLGNISIVGNRLAGLIPHIFIPAALAVFIASIARLATRKFGDSANRRAGRSALLIQSLLFSWIFTLVRNQEFNRRDIPVLLGFAAAAQALCVRGRGLSRALLFAAGLMSAVTYVYTIDRGPYYTAALAICFLFHCYVEPEFGPGRALWVALGTLFGWALAVASFGSVEFNAFLGNTGMFYSSKELYDGYVYHLPHFGQLKDQFLLPMVLIALQGLAIVCAFLLVYRKRISPRTGFAQCLLAASALIYYRSSLGRCDIGHILYGSSFAFLGTGFVLWQVLGLGWIPRQARWVAWVVVAGINLNLLVGQVRAVPWEHAPEKLAAVRTLLTAPDDLFLEPAPARALARFRTIFADEPCYFGLSGEGAWSYLLRKPFCGKFFSAWFASPEILQREMIQEVAQANPRYLVYEGPAPWSAVDGVPNEVRLKLATEWVRGHYTFYEDVEGWKVYRRIKL